MSNIFTLAIPRKVCNTTRMINDKTVIKTKLKNINFSSPVYQSAIPQSYTFDDARYILGDNKIYSKLKMGEKINCVNALATECCRELDAEVPNLYFADYCHDMERQITLNDVMRGYSIGVLGTIVANLAATIATKGGFPNDLALQISMGIVGAGIGYIASDKSIKAGGMYSKDTNSIVLNKKLCADQMKLSTMHEIKHSHRHSEERTELDNINTVPDVLSHLHNSFLEDGLPYGVNFAEIDANDFMVNFHEKHFKSTPTFEEHKLRHLKNKEQFEFAKAKISSISDAMQDMYKRIQAGEFDADIRKIIVEI